ncbi:MAG: ribosome biogenesis GTP-binding protein YihA/YsxC [Paracoccaceae bacterium]|nr:ribosome biogenesis GTP-binding protein YihA/YsxC [Paracoccaceae bacterium]
MRFVTGAADVGGFPPADRIEVCFSGRSNVGKSRLINALTSQSTLARISRTPGRTQQINFFALADRYYLVDVPGYGFARAPLKTIQRWQRLLGAYLAGRPSLRRVFLLIDARHGPKPADEEIMELLDRSAVTFQVVMTKSDKIGPARLADSLAATARTLARHPTAFPEIVPTSAVTGAGIASLRSIIAAMD